MEEMKEKVSHHVSNSDYNLCIQGALIFGLTPFPSALVILKDSSHNTKRMDEGWGQELHILGGIIQPLRRMLMGHRPLAFEEVGPHVTSEDVTGKASAGPVS